jgi:hypothetical protein
MRLERWKEQKDEVTELDTGLIWHEKAPARCRRDEILVEAEVEEGEKSAPKDRDREGGRFKACNPYWRSLLESYTRGLNSMRQSVPC